MCALSLAFFLASGQLPVCFPPSGIVCLLPLPCIPGRAKSHGVDTAILGKLAMRSRLLLGAEIIMP